MDSGEGSVQSDANKSRFDLPELKTRWIYVWFILFIILIVIAFIIPIPLQSYFAQHLPIAYGVLLICIPVIAYLTDEMPENRNLPFFSNTGLIILIIIGILGITIITWFPTMGIIDGNIITFLFLLPVLISIFIFKIPFSDLGFRGTVRDVKVAVLIAAVYGTLVFVAVGYNELIAFLDWMGPYAFSIIPVLLQSILLAIITVLIFIAIPEEFFFRVIVQSSLSERLGAARGLLLASLIFGLFHIPANYMLYFAFSGDVELSLLSALVIAFIAQSQIGLILGVSWHRTRSLILPVAIHAVHDIVEMLPIFILLSLGAIIF